MILELIDEAVESGARLDRACDTLGLTTRTIQRWCQQGEQGFDRRLGPKTPPRNKLSSAERKRVLDAANRLEHRDLSPKQIVTRASTWHPSPRSTGSCTRRTRCTIASRVARGPWLDRGSTLRRGRARSSRGTSRTCAARYEGRSTTSISSRTSGAARSWAGPCTKRSRWTYRLV